MIDPAGGACGAPNVPLFLELVLFVSIPPLPSILKRSFVAILLWLTCVSDVITVNGGAQSCLLHPCCLAFLRHDFLHKYHLVVMIG